MYQCVDLATSKVSFISPRGLFCFFSLMMAFFTCINTSLNHVLRVFVKFLELKPKFYTSVTSRLINFRSTVVVHRGKMTKIGCLFKYLGLTVYLCGMHRCVALHSPPITAAPTPGLAENETLFQKAQTCSSKVSKIFKQWSNKMVHGTLCKNERNCHSCITSDDWRMKGTMIGDEHLLYTLMYSMQIDIFM